MFEYANKTNDDCGSKLQEVKSVKIQRVVLTSSVSKLSVAHTIINKNNIIMWFNYYNKKYVIGASKINPLWILKFFLILCQFILNDF